MNNKKKKIIVLRIVFIMLLVITFMIIFIFSSQNGEELATVSKGLLYDLIKLLFRDGELKESKIIIYEAILRKVAHFSIYTSVGIWSMASLETFFIEENNNKRRFIISLIIGFLYACSDEIHQSFLTGRMGSFIDVILDTIGVANGIVLVMIIIKCYEIKKISNNKIKKL